MVYNNQPSGPATIYVGAGAMPAQTFCTSDGWTVIQSRGQFGNSPDFFYKNWEEYKKGFGEAGDFFATSWAHIIKCTMQAK